MHAVVMMVTVCLLQPCIVFEFKCDADYVGYTRQQLFQCINELKHAFCYWETLTGQTIRRLMIEFTILKK